MKIKRQDMMRIMLEQDGDDLDISALIGENENTEDRGTKKKSVFEETLAYEKRMGYNYDDMPTNERPDVFSRVLAATAGLAEEDESRIPNLDSTPGKNIRHNFADTPLDGKPDPVSMSIERTIARKTEESKNGFKGLLEYEDTSKYPEKGSTTEKDSISEKEITPIQIEIYRVIGYTGRKNGTYNGYYAETLEEIAHSRRGAELSHMIELKTGVSYFSSDPYTRLIGNLFTAGLNIGEIIYAMARPDYIPEEFNETEISKIENILQNRYIGEKSLLNYALSESTEYDFFRVITNMVTMYKARDNETPMRNLVDTLEVYI